MPFPRLLNSICRARSLANIVLIAVGLEPSWPENQLLDLNVNILERILKSIYLHIDSQIRFFRIF